ncbi:hypothetical protein HanRHA438_Chr11g0525751 [Helianthus annuus]|nr:hypothetical protein HanRHA438_Chr11g0525751 [Helianthus annuus]
MSGLISFSGYKPNHIFSSVPFIPLHRLTTLSLLPLVQTLSSFFFRSLVKPLGVSRFAFMLSFHNFGSYVEGLLDFDCGFMVGAFSRCFGH